MQKLTTLISIIIAILASVLIFSQTLPHTINYQGVLKNASGVIVTNGNYNLKFTIYEGDVAIWTETKSITVTDGIFNTQLGSVTPINLPFDNEYYLGITIGTDSELTSRIKISSVPYSFMSMNVKDGSITTQKLNQMGATAGQVLKWNGTIWNPAIDETSGAGFTLPYSGTATTGSEGSVFSITNNLENDGYAIFGSGHTGLFGHTSAANGLAIYGNHQGSGTGGGILGVTSSPEGYGIKGLNVSSTGTNYGVYGKSASSLGRGIEGHASATAGMTFGVLGENKSSSGAGVAGFSSSTTRGTAIYGVSYSLDGYSGYFFGSKFYVSGNVGIGTESPEYRLVVEAPGITSTGIGAFRNSSGDNKVILRQNSNGSGAVNIYRGDNTVALSLIGDGYSYFNGGRVGIGTDTPTQMLHIVGNAYKTEGGTAWATSSDIRLKDILGEYEKGLNEIISLQPVRYIYKKDNPRKIDSSTEQVGFVAQDVQKIFPDAVTEAEDGYLDFNIHSINVALVNAIKELKAENDELKARLEKIEKYINQTTMR